MQMKRMICESELALRINEVEPTLEATPANNVVGAGEVQIHIYGAMITTEWAVTDKLA